MNGFYRGAEDFVTFQVNSSPVLVRPQRIRVQELVPPGADPLVVGTVIKAQDGSHGTVAERQLWKFDASHAHDRSQR